jgi:beta-mannanase
MVSWVSQKLGGGASQSTFQNRDITNGTYDSYIRKWATAAKTWGHPFFLRFDYEMNGWWYAWGEGKTGGVIVNGNSSGDFVRAWRHVHDIFKSVGAKNATWVWCPNIMSTSTSYPSSLSQIYPGDSYVDWTCLDGYNKTTTWMNFQALFMAKGFSWMRNSYQAVVNVAPAKPMMIGETASNEAGDGGTKKGQWHRYGLGTELPTYMPKVKAYVYFNWNGDNPAKTYRIDSTANALDGFQDGIGNGRYAANGYASISTSPIPALP